MGIISLVAGGKSEIFKPALEHPSLANRSVRPSLWGTVLHMRGVRNTPCHAWDCGEFPQFPFVRREALRKRVVPTIQLIMAKTRLRFKSRLLRRNRLPPNVVSGIPWCQTHCSPMFETHPLWLFVPVSGTNLAGTLS